MSNPFTISDFTISDLRRRPEFFDTVAERSGWQGHVLDPRSALVYPKRVTVIGDASRVHNPDGLIAPGGAATTIDARGAGTPRLLLDLGADPNKVAKSGRTALMVAAFSNPSAEIVRELLGKGADPKAVDHNGWTTLNAAAIGNDTATIRMLVDAGVDVVVARGSEGLKSSSSRTSP